MAIDFRATLAFEGLALLLVLAQGERERTGRIEWRGARKERECGSGSGVVPSLASLICARETARRGGETGERDGDV